MFNKILIVDDSFVSRRMITNIVKDLAEQIDYADDGEKAIEMVNKNDYQLVLLDLLMDKLDGFGVLAHFKENNISIPTIVISADIQESTRNKCLELGALDIINKPPKADEIIKVISQIKTN